ncbi:YlcI/YnfO family protein [Xenorhabdus vietnamensis]|uniref:YlcI/YnfO family protein n=1 Tax=Xenorhabdus vietnamensis TaxID=351656 RepID=UPI000A324E6B|nr:YlcI/YnfO family protein [Xenorhabdus vietnamensis]
MPTPNKNAKSQLTTVRVPHDVMEGMEAVKQGNESNAGFIITAMRVEIARRQSGGNCKDPLLSSLDALARVEEIGTKVNEEIRLLIGVAQEELQQRKAKASSEQ